MFVASYLCELGQQWQCLSKSENYLWWWGYALIVGRGEGKVGDLLLNMYSTFKNNNYDNIPKSVTGCYTLIPTRALKQMDTQIVSGMTTLTLWKMGNYRIWQAKIGT